MGVGNLRILTINAGSSSIKIDVFYITASQDMHRTHRLNLTGIGLALSRLTIAVGDDGNEQYDCTATTHGDAITMLIDKLSELVPLDEITAVGHRVVYGGTDYDAPVIISDEVLERLSQFIDFDPEHAPASLYIIKSLRQKFIHATHVACFDTAFFHHLPRVAQIVAIPRQYQDLGIRRYGYHGLSYSYLMTAFEQLAGDTAARGRVIYAHLGSGASLAATRNKQPIETTMGFSPTSGLVMSSRSGDIDPSLSWFMNKKIDMTLDEYNHMINAESGLLGVSGVSSDMYTLLQNESTNQNVADAIELFCYQVRKSIGSLATTIGGIDSLVFSGGIGEQSPVLRARICEGLSFMGIHLDDGANNHSADLISSPQSSVGVHVIPTNESQTIAHDTIQTLRDTQETN